MHLNGFVERKYIVCFRIPQETQRLPQHEGHDKCTVDIQTHTASSSCRKNKKSHEDDYNHILNPKEGHL